MCFEHTFLPTRLYIASSWPSSIHALCISCFSSYLLLVGLYYFYFTVMITVKRKIHSVPRCIVFSFPVKNYIFSATNFLHVHFELSSVLNTFEAAEEKNKNRRIKKFGQGELQTLRSLRGNEILRMCQFRHSPRSLFSSILEAR